MTKRPIPRFKLIRKRLGMSQREFADYLTNECNVKTAKTTIGRYEICLVYPTKQTLEKFAKALQVTPYYLSGEGPNKEDVHKKIVLTLVQGYFNHDMIESAIRTWISLDQQLMLLQAKQAKDKGKTEFLSLKFTMENKRADEFWKEYFAFLLKNQDLAERLVGTTDEEFASLLNTAILDHYHEEKLASNLDQLLVKSDEIVYKTSLLVLGLRDSKKLKDDLLKEICEQQKHLEELKAQL